MRRCSLLTGLLLAFQLAGPSPSSAQVAVSPMLPVDDDFPRTDVRAVIRDSLRFLMMEHTTRVVTQGKTRRELSGPFWGDYRRSVRVPRQWGDTDGWAINYIGHPGQGAVAGFIWAAHDPGSPAEDAGFNRAYWMSRLRAGAWSLAYSIQFEVGPLSEASIGNVGLNPATVGWVDHVVTPIGGFGVMVAEDAIDRYVLGWLERRSGNRVWRAVVRSALNPSRSLANVAGARAPWHRDLRPLGVR